MSTSNTSLPSPLASTQSRRHHKKPYKSWLKDGVNGGPCSMQIVVQWLSANYAAKWRDDSDNRMPKKLLLQEILDQMRQAGIHHRLAKDVASKISTLQSNYRVAREWYDVIGSQWRKAGAQETDVKKEVLRRFPYWDELHAAFGATTGLNNSNPSTGGTITTTTTTTTTTTIGGNVASTSKMTTMTTHDKDIAGWPMSIRSIIHSIDEEANMTIPSLSSWFSSTEQVIEREQQEQAVATATVAAATAQATATNATATTARVISLSENSQTVIVSTATTTDIATEPKDTAPVALGKRLRVNDEEEESDEIDDDDESDEFEDDNDNGQALIAEKEKTRRVRVRADLVKRLMNLGRSKEEIATELKSCV
ncbi:hypothetical protein BX666DRAFT_2016768 [Dichotomocladium elegans]|nr:hypothetical protein BX666DRAFT_2016768 [Dichotomocladium elegans]